MSEQREAIIIGALLHDIGKLAQKAGEKLDAQGKLDAEYFCPKDKNNLPTHLHVIFSERYIKEILKATPWEQAANFALRHHLPYNYEDKIIQLADWLSSGERRDREIEEKIPEVDQEPLISIFSQIVLKDEKDNEVRINPHYCPVVDIGSEIRGLFPKEKKEEAINGTNNFQELWRKLKEESKLLTKDNPVFDILLSRILSLLEKWSLFVPSSAYKDKPEISLFHHLKSTAAIATCLYDLKIDENELESIKVEIRNNWQGENLKKERFILLTGDISGIQDFIYSVSSEKALRGLRGRSFYLQLLSEIVAQYILDQFNLTWCNLLFSGGGNFSILLPNTSNAESKIGELSKEIEDRLFKAHQGELGIVIGKIFLSYNDFSLNNFGKTIEKLARKLAREKRREFKDIISVNFFKPIGRGGELKACEICGREIEQEGVCQLCKSFEDLANKIKNARYIEIEKIGKAEIKDKVNQWYELIKGFGYNYWFKKIDEQPNLRNLVYLFNETNFLNKGCSRFRFEAIYSPEGTLEDMAKKAVKDGRGIEKWAALKMDVDNLGMIFSEGLPNKSISRYSMLSYMFSLFFSKGIREIVEYKYRDCCVVYSGGDDLFILGPWSELPKIALEIYENFRKYTSSHPSITISCGIYIAPSKKFPVYQAAKEADVAEKKAKIDNKNKITFLDTPIGWDIKEEKNEFKRVKYFSDSLKEIIDKNVARSILTILYAGYRERKLLKDKKLPYLRMWRLFYMIKRFMERYPNAADRIEEIRKQAICDFDLIPNLDVAICWADYLTRKEV